MFKTLGPAAGGNNTQRLLLICLERKAKLSWLQQKDKLDRLLFFPAVAKVLQVHQKVLIRQFGTTRDSHIAPHVLVLKLEDVGKHIVQNL